MSWITNLLIGLFAWSPKPPPAPAPAPAPAEIRSEALVVVADGIGGFDLCGRALARVIKASGLSYTTRVVRWGHGVGRWYADLSNAANCDARADEVAETVRLHHDAHPGEPIFLVGKSGGCAVIVKVLERLSGSGVVVERVVLLAPALSPGYDLTKALGSVRRDVSVFWSPLDVIILGAGTRIFGTSDRVWCSGAGRVGFLRPKAGTDDPARVAAYKKLRQIRWSPRMSSTGYLGGHLGPDSPRFLKKYVVPLLRVEPPPEC
ncbi:MAG: alpha/beta hydrolase [Paludisphaera borealis]|uniref:serine aminopeptidase domain-containing protein n=1 Tax=Paludisphaera borealis TaxID=1387353 RepID=UPI0028407D32|nr:alpha/beta hydrolase [Paludisphaera borealis]MDR3620396.1 alpha/beta hydrolase [Paludisphaera borealis]